MSVFEEAKAKFEQIFEKAKEKMPEIASWNKVYQFIVEDTGEEFYVEISNGTLKVEKGKHPKPIATLTLKSDTLMKILSGELDAMKAFMMRQIKITGNVLDTMNLKKLLDAGTKA